MSPLSTNTYACTKLQCNHTHIMHLVFAHFFATKMVFFREPDPSIVGASDIGQGSIYLKYVFTYLKRIELQLELQIRSHELIHSWLVHG